MSCSVMIKAEDGEERRVCVDSEELKNMTVEEFRRRACAEDDEDGHYELVYENKRLEDHQTLHSCGVRNGVIIHQKREPCVIYPQGPEKINDLPLPRAMSMEKLVPMRKFEITYVTVRVSEKH